MNLIKQDPPMTKHRKALRAVAVVVGVLLLIRLILPYVLLRVVNDRLAKVPGYYGHIADLDLALIRGAYSLEGFYLDQVDSLTTERTPFLAAANIDLSVEWKALLKGRVVGELVVDGPEIRFTKDAMEPEQVQEDTTSLGEVLGDLMPLQINRVQMNKGTLRYRDPHASPKVDIQLSAFDLLAENLRNSYDSSSVLPAKLRLDGDLYGGALVLNMRMDPLAEQPTFDLNAEVSAVELPQLNDFLKAYGKFDVSRGTFGLYTEFAAKEGAFTGYVKPLIKDLDVVGLADREDNFFNQLWEQVVGAAGVVFRNQRKDQVATKVELNGRLDGPRVNTLSAVFDLLGNAFIQALLPAVDHQIDLRSVDAPATDRKGVFGRLFGGDDKEGEKKEQQ